ncbi:carboxymuconolactone decarboxylase family protein [Tsukamurella sputi]|uniref:Carboxymuconolactone decarboxylase family protein n=1 Tax=Tsukamurella sputi TaxID=2591848 RepID=A0A5C5RVH1_9ACTN|nr:carboxymuconolactone decarboxylase family protein [Tsukamurella sputi]TWS26131.1 carboxymuconolactone decarboxylase family protein [Tsukamurella sputi]
MNRTPGATSSPETYKALVALDSRLARSLGAALYDIVKLRASQINGCAFCVDKHSRDLERLGTPTRTIYGVAAWEESPFFDETQRVALAFVERLTAGIDAVDDALWDEAGRLLGEERRTDLLIAVGTINTWNMLGITTHLHPAS